MTNETTPLLGVRAAAEWFNVHPNTIHRWVRDGKLPESRGPGGRLVFTREQLQGVITNAATRHLPT